MDVFDRSHGLRLLEASWNHASYIAEVFIGTSSDPLVCTLVDPPCIQSMNVACECISSGSAQLSVQLATNNVAAEEGYTLDYVILESQIRREASRINTTAFPLPTVEQVRNAEAPIEGTVSLLLGSVARVLACCCPVVLLVRSCPYSLSSLWTITNTDLTPMVLLVTCHVYSYLVPACSMPFFMQFYS